MLQSPSTQPAVSPLNSSIPLPQVKTERERQRRQTPCSKSSNSYPHTSFHQKPQPQFPVFQDMQPPKRQNRSYSQQRECSFRKGLSKVSELVAVQALEVFLLEENVNAFLDVADLRREAGLDLLDRLGHKLGVLHSLARLHDTNDGRLEIMLALHD
jgi:hypothetical protein